MLSTFYHIALTLSLSTPAITTGLCQQPSLSQGTAPAVKSANRLPSLRLGNIGTANPQRDLAQSIMRGDLRFVGIYGYALSVPGVAGGAGSRIVALKGVNAVEGTSDFIGPEQARLQPLAVRYAARYNTLLLDHLRQNHDPDVSRVQQEIEAELETMEHASPSSDAARALRTGKADILMLVGVSDGDGDIPGLTWEQLGERTIHTLVFSPDFATEEQKRRMHSLSASYIAPYNRALYKAHPAVRRSLRHAGATERSPEGKQAAHPAPV